MKKFILLFVVFVLLFSGCRKKVVVDNSGGPLRLITDPKLMPKFFDDFDKESILGSVRKSIKYMETHRTTFKQQSGQFSQTEVLASLKLFETILMTSSTKEEFDARIKAEFDVYITMGESDNEVLFTGYYQPIIPGSYQRTEKFKYPLYRRPNNLVKGTPYLTKTQIDGEGALNGQGLELLWVESYLMAHIVQVQGTAIIRLPDNTEISIGYNGDNSCAYTPIIKEIIKDGYIGKNNISLDSLEKFFIENPSLEKKYIMMNDRYIFFQEIKGGPYGSLGIEVTPRRSLATHKFQNTEYLFPPCGIAFVDCKLPIIDGERVAYDRTSFFAINQDTGSAITGPGRADIYFGAGDRAKTYAGFTHTKGKLYYLKVKHK
jgi:membrane-bound lytic murein transglycosylase A